MSARKLKMKKKLPIMFAKQEKVIADYKALLKYMPKKEAVSVPPGSPLALEYGPGPNGEITPSLQVMLQDGLEVAQDQLLFIRNMLTACHDETWAP